MDHNKLPLARIIKEFNDNQDRLVELSQNPDSDSNEIVKLSKKLSSSQKSFDLATSIINKDRQITDAKADISSMDKINDNEMIELLEQEIIDNSEEIERDADLILTYLTPIDDRDDKNVLLEIKAGAGGDESALFASEILKSYQIMCEQIGLNFKITALSANDLGGNRDVTCEITGNNPFSWFK